MGLTDLSLIRDCYKWELDAILEGLLLQRLDDRESNAELAFNLRYTLNAKHPQTHKVLNKNKEMKEIQRLFHDQSQPSADQDRVEAYRRLMEHFKKRREP